MTVRANKHRAVAYARMSTDRQTFSIAQQLAAIGVYAESHSFEIVRTFLDEGKSGLALNGRAGLRALLAEVLSGTADFNTVLVLDVSRWGRFQDVDESAHYEFICRQAGVKIIYCAEPFIQDGSAMASIIKGMKRAMAAEYSRELSSKVLSAHCRNFAAGYKAGGKAGYGFRRAAYEATGEPKKILAKGERKPAITDRVKIVPGTAAEAEVVRRIYKLYLEKRLGDTAIARILNAEGIPSEVGDEWNLNLVKGILTNAKYYGLFRFNQTSQRLATPKVQNPPTAWIDVAADFEPIITKEEFTAAQAERARRRRRPTNDEILDHIRRLYARHARIDAHLISKSRLGYTCKTVMERFGCMTEAYLAAGIPSSNAMKGAQLRSSKSGMVRALLQRVKEIIPTAGATWVDFQSGRRPILTVNGTVRLSVTVACANHAAPGRIRWRMKLRDVYPSDYVLCARLDPLNKVIEDYWLFPVHEYRVTDLWLAPHLFHVNQRHRYEQLEQVFGL